LNDWLHLVHVEHMLKNWRLCAVHVFIF